MITIYSGIRRTITVIDPYNNVTHNALVELMDILLKGSWNSKYAERYNEIHAVIFFPVLPPVIYKLVVISVI